jgi:glyoxylase-like metal-dependent hydrolase (beta-lactamase superfamily II)
VETGAGDKLNAKLRDISALEIPRLVERLRITAACPDDIDIVINTHLHFDHCGGNTRVEKDKVVPPFPTRVTWCRRANTSTPKIPPSATAPVTSRRTTSRSRLPAMVAARGRPRYRSRRGSHRVPGHTATCNA